MKMVSVCNSVMNYNISGSGGESGSVDVNIKQLSTSNDQSAFNLDQPSTQSDDNGKWMSQ